MNSETSSNKSTSHRNTSYNKKKYNKRFTSNSVNISSGKSIIENYLCFNRLPANNATMAFVKKCIDRIISSLDALSSYFSNSSDIYNSLIYRNLEMDESSEEIPLKVKIYFMFISNAMEFFNKALLKLEANNTSVLDIHNILVEHRKEILRRDFEDFYGFNTIIEMGKLNSAELNSMKCNGQHPPFPLTGYQKN